MKQILVFLGVIVLTSVLNGQSVPAIDMGQYQAAKTNAGKGKILMSLEPPGSYTEHIIFWFGLLNHFKEQNDVTGINYSQLSIGTNYSGFNEYHTALKYLLPALHGFESEKDSFGIIASNTAVFIAFTYSQNFDEGISYINKSTSIAKLYPDKNLYASVLMNGADCLIRMKQPDRALSRLQEAIKIYYEFKDTINITAALGTLGQAYLAKNDFEIAKPFFLQSMYYSRMFDQEYFLTYNAIDLSHLFFETAQYDSSLAYAHIALYYARDNEPLGSMYAFEWLYKTYEILNNQDSAFKYFRLAIRAKDSIFSMEKTRSIQAMEFQEKIRLQEIALESKKAELRRMQNIQYALIALGLVVFIMLFLFLSHSVIIQPKFIEYLGVIGLLILFEFFNLLLHPFLERVTHHSPLLILLALVCIAGVLIPLHHRVEVWLIKKFVEKNKKNRLASAKKIPVSGPSNKE